MSMADLSTDATEKAAQAVTKRLEKEIIGAWRAGYNYLYVASDPRHFGGNSRDITTYSITYQVFPSNGQLSESPLDVPMTEYDLSNVGEYL